MMPVHSLSYRSSQRRDMFQRVMARLSRAITIAAAEITVDV
jgi:hypothetical protein